MIRQFQPYFKALCWLFPCQWSFLCQGGAQPQKWPVLLLGFSHLEKLYWGGWWIHVVSGSDQYQMPWEECKSNTSIWWRFASTDAIWSSEVISVCVTGPCFWGDLVGTTDRNSIFTGKRMVAYHWIRLDFWVEGYKCRWPRLMFSCPNRRFCVTLLMLLLSLPAVGILRISWARMKAIIWVLHCTGNWTSFEDAAA